MLGNRNYQELIPRPGISDLMKVAGPLAGLADGTNLPSWMYLAL